VNYVGQNLYVVLLKGIVILSAAAWQGDDMQAETSKVNVA